MKWYAYAETDTTYDMILDHNTTATVQWSSVQSNKDMKEVAEALTNDTRSWINTLNARLITADEIATITGNTSWSSSTNIDHFFFDSNNQTQTANGLGTSRYSWLFDYTGTCTAYGCNEEDSSNYGYWTSSAYIDWSSSVWVVYCYGYIDESVSTDSVRGLRPVITINK